jgi:ABC-type antimicrobial peptide transport system permease subunit
MAVSALFAAAVGLWLAYNVVNALRSGIARAKIRSYKRTTQPAQYWITVTFQIVIAFGCAYAAYYRLSQ